MWLSPVLIQHVTKSRVQYSEGNSGSLPHNFDCTSYSSISLGFVSGYPHFWAHAGSLGVTLVCIRMPNSISSLYLILIQLLKRT